MTDATPEKHVRHDSKTGFTIIATSFEHHVVFVLYDMIGVFEGDDSNLAWQKIGAVSSPDPVYRSDFPDVLSALAQAEIYLHGSVKWDGCSNWHFDEQDRNMLHGCSRRGVQRLGDVMALCWDWSAELCQRWCP
jgi:hypothetical protein